MILVSLAAFLLAAPSFADDFPYKMQSEAMQATVRITGGNSQGTGVIVGHKNDTLYILTAWHVVDGPRKLTVTTFPLDADPEATKTYTAEVMAHADKKDLALLRIKTKDKPPGSVSLCPSKQVPASINFPALSSGCVDNNLPFTHVEKVLQAQKIVAGDLEMRAWKLELAPEEGYSGGPLLDREGRLLGIASGRREGRGYYSHIDEIRAFLKREKLDWLAGE